MKVLLIRPGTVNDENTRLPESLNKRQGVLQPLGLAYISSVLKERGYQVKIIDGLVFGLGLNQVKKEISSYRPDVVGVSIMTSTLFAGLDICEAAKQHNAIVIVGGPHLSIYPRETISFDCVDYGINGEGEYSMADLLDNISKRSDLCLEDISGLIYKKKGKVHINPPSIIEDIDSLPFPDYKGLPMREYNSIIGLYPVSTMISTRGCPHQCGFCFKQPADMKFRARSALKVVDEMEFLVNEYGVKEIMFYDDVMTLDRSRVVKICEEIMKRDLKVKWEAPTRIEYVDSELLGLMAKAGCIRLRYGVESGDDDILKLMKKNTTIGKIKHVFDITKKSGIETFAYFMIGYIHETEQTIKKTIKFALEIDPDLIMFTVATPLPGTPLFDMAVTEGFVSPDYWLNYAKGKSQCKRIPYFVPDAEKWMQRAYRSFYFRPAYIMRKIIKVKNIDELKKLAQAGLGLLSFKMKADQSNRHKKYENK